MSFTKVFIAAGEDSTLRVSQLFSRAGGAPELELGRVLGELWEVM